MQWNFDREIERRGTDSFKWDANERLFGKRDLLPFWVADMDFAAPEAVLEAIRERLEHPVFGYGIRSDTYLDSITDWLAERHGWEVPREWLVFCPPSTIVGMFGLVSILTEPGQTIAAPVPTYGPLLGLIEKNQRRSIRIPLKENNGRFELDVRSAENKLEADTHMFIFCSPHNPTGRVFSRAELEALAALAEDKDLLVVSDEVHCDLVMPGHRHIPYGSIGGERSVSVISPNKAFNTAGIPQATLIIPDAGLRERYRQFLDLMQLNHDSTFGAAAMIGGYTRGKEWLDALIDYLHGNHRLVAEYLREHLPKVRKIEAEATYLAWLDFRATGLDENQLMRRLVDIGGVGLYGASEFGLEGEPFFRMNLGCPRSRIEKGLDGIRRALAET
ncbi:MAG: PatB family C-S lyase [Woeseiaceae bacterium]|nr:PatB family C-S lyase [Woeseiaceae bacterium]